MPVTRPDPGFAHGDVLHSRPAVVNYGRTANDIVVFYGANDGMLHAVKGGQELRDRLRQRVVELHPARTLRQVQAHARPHADHHASSHAKPYFVDGSTTVYT